ncbi:MarR family winged helix-turn-helix transcriptional regulator [Nonomuraea sp. KM90]|uniref:MarR family winged helix-turn-helix transcriptional regulator n=1 Tax=Nonomuraea sp. KM90 TaxID=3457428 RepID=UPI003FCDD70C
MESKDGRDLDVARLAGQLRGLVLQQQDAWLELDLTMPQLRALFAVRRRSGCTVSELAESLGQRLAAASALANRLVRAGLLRHVPDQEDRRRVRLELTDDAEQMLSAVDRRSTDRFAAILGRMSPQGRDALTTALLELIELMSSGTPQSPAATATPGRTDEERP